MAKKFERNLNGNSRIEKIIIIKIRKLNSRLDTAEKRIKNYKTGLPWWRSGWESACQCRGHGFEPWSGRIRHAAEQLGP